MNLEFWVHFYDILSCELPFWKNRSRRKINSEYTTSLLVKNGEFIQQVF